MQKLVKTGKNTEINKQSIAMSSFGLIEENMELSHIHLAVLGFQADFSWILHRFY